MSRNNKLKLEYIPPGHARTKEQTKEEIENIYTFVRHKVPTVVSNRVTVLLISCFIDRLWYVNNGTDAVLKMHLKEAIRLMKEQGY